MRNSWTRWLSAALVLLCCAAPARAAQPTTRVFAMQPKLDLAWMDSRADFHDKLFGLADKKLRSPGKPLVQEGADDFASHLRHDGRSLVVWPEDIGLWSAFVGQRGAEARASGSLVGAIATLLTSYAPQMSYYGALYPQVAARFPQVRLLALGLTDTFGRTAVETFSQMAARYHVWLEAGVDMTQSWRIVCNTNEHPPQQRCDEANPAKVAALGDPEDTGRGYAYEATSPDVSNMALLFGPDGKLVSKQIKTYLTPIEVGQAEGQVAALDLVPGSVAGGLTAVHTPIGTLGFVTSKDAWMPDVVDRLEQGGVNLLIQPEFFVGDLATTTGMWSADTLKASGYSDLLAHPGFSAMALASSVGNVFDFSADQQSHIAVRATKPGGGKWLIGQPPSPGLVGVTPWVVRDPVRRGETIPQRRKRLGEAGMKLAPGSGVACSDPAKPAPCENGHVEGVVWHDVPVGPPARRAATRARTRFGPAHALSVRAARNAAVAMAGRYAVAAFEQRTPLGWGVMTATSSDRGAHWSRARAVAAEAGNQWWPAVALDRRGRVVLAYSRSVRVGKSYSVPQVVFAQGRIRSGRVLKLSTPLPVAPTRESAGQSKPALALDARGVVHIAFVDTSTRFADDNLPQAGIYYGRIDGGVPVGKGIALTRLDDGAADPLAARMDNAWAPAVAASGRKVLVSWIDFMHYDWDVMSRLSADGGADFAAAVDSNLETSDVEDLSDSPKPVFTSKGPFIAWTDFHKRDSVDRVHPLYDTYLARPGKPPIQADPYGGKQVDTFWPSPCADGADVITAFQDSATGVATVRVTRMRGGVKRSHALQLSDSTAAAYRPSLACSGGRFIAAWEDARRGASRIYAASGALARIH